MKKPITITLIFSLLLIAILIGTGCNKSSNTPAVIPSITTYTVISGLTGTSLQSYGLLTNNGGGTISAQGICWSSVNATPTTADSKTSVNVDTANFVSKITGLTPNTTYYIRAYAINEAGTGYGSVVQFKTNTATFAVTATVSTFAGTGTAGFVNNTAPLQAQFADPIGICTDGQNNVYVADFYNNVIRKITPAGVTTTYAGNGTLGYLDGSAANAEFYAPQGVAADAQGNIYVTDMGNDMIRKISTTGVVTTIAGHGIAGYSDGTGTTAAFNLPAGIAVSSTTGNIYIADRGNNMIRMITPAGVVSTLAGNLVAGQIDATGTAAAFSSPGAVAIDSKGNLYVTDLNNNALRTVTPAGVVTTLLGSSTLSLVLGAPWGVAIDATGNTYITDSNGRILELNSSGAIYSLAGVSGTTGFVNGTNINALFNAPRGVALDNRGALYVSDYNNNAIRKIVVTTTP